MLKTVVLSALSAIFLAGCAASPPNPSASTQHPANPDATEAPIPSPSQTLAVEGAPSQDSMPQTNHSQGDMKGMDMGAMNPSTPGMQPSPTSQPVASHGVVYTCTMHPQVLSDKPGNCPICGMKLVIKSEGARP